MKIDELIEIAKDFDVKFLQDGFPAALSTTGEYGLPCFNPIARRLKIYVDGKKQDYILAFDRLNNLIYRYCLKNDKIIVDGYFKIECLTNVKVDLEWLDD